MKALVIAGVVFVGLALICFVAFVGFVIMAPATDGGVAVDTPERKRVAPIPEVPEPEAKPADPWKMTMAKYEALQTGMSYAQVVKIIGKEGEELSRNDIAGITTVMYQWQNKSLADLGGANAMFQNDKLIQKTQFNLK